MRYISAAILKHTIDKMDYGEIEIVTGEGVYPPSEDSALAAEMVSFYLSGREKEKPLDVLDLGTATGILGIFAAGNEMAGSVTFADINPDAVALANKNAERNKGLINCELNFIESDLFSDINGKYDLIVFNAPYLRSEEDSKMDDIRWSGGKEGAELSINFLRGAVSHMKEAGALILVLSSLSHTGMVMDEMHRLSLRTLKELKRHYFFEDILVWLIGRGIE